jgi:hypothetical protein
VRLESKLLVSAHYSSVAYEGEPVPPSLGALAEKAGPSADCAAGDLTAERHHAARIDVVFRWFHRNAIYAEVYCAVNEKVTEGPSQISLQRLLEAVVQSS